MRNRNPSIHRYYYEIRSVLPCGGKLKRKVIKKIHENISEYLKEKPKADYSEIVSRFGTPQQIASTYIDEMQTHELLKRIKINKKILIIVAWVAVAIVAIWLAFAGILYVDSQDAVNGYYDVSVEAEENTIIDEVR